MHDKLEAVPVDCDHLQLKVLTKASHEWKQRHMNKTLRRCKPGDATLKESAVARVRRRGQDGAGSRGATHVFGFGFAAGAWHLRGEVA